MDKQRGAPEAGVLKSAEEIAAILAKLPRENREKLEGVIIGANLMHQASAVQSADRPA